MRRMNDVIWWPPPFTATRRHPALDEQKTRDQVRHIHEGPSILRHQSRPSRVDANRTATVIASRFHLLNNIQVETIIQSGTALKRPGKGTPPKMALLCALGFRSWVARTRGHCGLRLWRRNACSRISSNEW